jgi:YebC/PmpR family DNA-binding regulatory protein
MAGHSKWAQIKRTKAVKDQKKGATFAKYARDIMVAVKLGGADPEGNFRLRTAIEKAKTAGLPNDNIKRAIEKGQGAGGADNMESLSYEGYGPGGVAILIDAMTDNRNRTAGDIRSYFNKYSGNLGADGCVAWIFEEKGLIRVDKSAAASEESLFEAALEAGAMDFQANDDEDAYTIVTLPEHLNSVCQGLSGQGIAIASAEVTRIPQNAVTVSDAAQATQLMKLLDAIENHDDVQAVYANFEMDERLLEQLTAG